MKTNVFLLLTFFLLCFSQQILTMQKNKSKFIVECILGKTGLRGYGEKYTTPTQFTVIGFNANNSNNIDAKVLFTLQLFTNQLELAATENTSRYFLTQHENKSYTTKVNPYMSKDKTLLQLTVRLSS